MNPIQRKDVQAAEMSDYEEQIRIRRLQQQNMQVQINTKIPRDEYIEILAFCAKNGTDSSKFFSDAVADYLKHQA